jgi:sugar/nucleoside kinase (ribokinase family)
MEQVTYDLVGVGSPIVDVLARVPDSFLSLVGGDKGGMVLVGASDIERWMQQLDGKYVESPGGSAGNTAFAAARLGLRTTFVGKVGNDTGAAYYSRAFSELGGDSSRFKIGDIANGRCLSLITPDSQRTLRTDLGAAATLRPEEISVVDFQGCRHAHIEGYLLFNPALMQAVLQAAKEAGCTISLDLASFEVVQASIAQLPDILRSYVDMVFANEDEAAAYCGPDKSYEQMARELGLNCAVAVVKAGARGAWLCHEEKVTFAPALPGIKSVDTTGAGDFWAAGFLSGWLNDQPLEVCAERGARMGAEIVQQVGTVLSPQTWERIERAFMPTNG